MERLQDPKEISRLRPLGASERYTLLRSRLGIYLNVCVTASYHLRRANDESLKSALYRALAVLITRHPILSAVPGCPDASRPAFFRLPEIDLEDVLSIDDYQMFCQNAQNHDSAIESLIVEQHSTPFLHGNPLRPFWRLRVLDNLAASRVFHVCLCFHHSLFDTKSALVFHEDLEHALSNPTNSPITRIVSSPQDALIPPLEAFNKLPIDAETLHNVTVPLPASPDEWSGEPQALPVQTHLSTFWLSPETMDTLRTQCKEHQVSISTLLMAALASAFFDALADRWTAVNGDCAVSLRHLLSEPVTERSMGCYVGSLKVNYSRTNRSLWDDAKRTKDVISKAVGKDSLLPSHSSYMDSIPDLASWLREKMGTKRSAAWELSNVGTLSSPQSTCNRNCEIESILFSQSAGATSGAVKVSVASGRDKRLGFCFSWQAGIVSDDLVKAVTASFRKQLDLVADAPPIPSTSGQENRSATSWSGME